MQPRSERTTGIGRRALLLGCALPPMWGWSDSRASQPPVLLTIVDGEAVVVDGARRLHAAPGLALAAGALIDTAANATLVRIEWANGTLVDLGPGTRAMVSPPNFRARSGQTPALYLLQGWAKLTGHSAAPSGGLVAPHLDLLPVAGSAVAWVGPPADHVFAETGVLRVLVRPGGASHSLGQGALYSSDSGVAARPPADWLKRVPRAFRDAIPSRAALAQTRAADASVLSPPTYEDLGAWLDAEPDLRRDFPRRFASLAHDPAFRKALLARLSAHPEWGPVLNPVR